MVFLGKITLKYNWSTNFVAIDAKVAGDSITKCFFLIIRTLKKRMVFLFLEIIGHLKFALHWNNKCLDSFCIETTKPGLWTFGNIQKILWDVITRTKGFLEIRL